MKLEKLAVCYYIILSTLLTYWITLRFSSLNWVKETVFILLVGNSKLTKISLAECSRRANCSIWTCSVCWRSQCYRRCARNCRTSKSTSFSSRAWRGRRSASGALPSGASKSASEIIHSISPHPAPPPFTTQSTFWPVFLWINLEPTRTLTSKLTSSFRNTTDVF